MKALPLVAVVLALGALTGVLIFMGMSLWPLFFCAVAAGISLGMVFGGQAVARDLAVRRLVTEAYRAGAAVARLNDLARVLGTPDVVQARTDAHRAEAEVWASRYANGESSDY